MRRHPLILALLAILLLPTATHPQEEIRRRQAELQTLREQIRGYEEKIKDQQKNETASLEMLDSYDRQGTLVRTLISRLRRDELELQRRIEATRKTLQRLEGQLSYLRLHYARYVTAVYKAGTTQDVELLLTSSSLNQFAVRAEYLRRFTAQRKKDATTIGRMRRATEETQARAQQELTEERRMIAAKAAEEDRLATLAEERRQVLQQIRKDRSQIQREMDRKLQAARQLEDMITQLIEADRIRREREAAESARKGEPPRPTQPAGDFESRRGKLRWPVGEGTIVARFGPHRHPTLRTITQNTGIDIAVKPGSSVFAVAPGEVSRLWWLPSYGNMIIINNYGGFRTIYTHLAEITVIEGQKLAEGEEIGISGESLDGPRLHFEIWKEREKQNPELWLGSP